MAADIRASSLKQPVDVAEAVHGVPGDYNLVALDYIEPAGLYSVGNVNELNAGYAADGYARVKDISALVTTFGVGELSALNAIAGAYSEYVPIVHIVGTPATSSQEQGALLHHTLGNGNFNTFSDMARSLHCTLVSLTDPLDIASQIDHAIRECYVQSRPVYITLPQDMVQQKIEGERLQTPIDLSFPQNDEEKEDHVVDVVLSSLKAAQRAIILVDACAIRHRALAETYDLVRQSGLPTFVAPMGKSAVDETLPIYCGVYAGDGSVPAVRERVENADLVLTIGAIKSDFNTAGFTYHVSQLNKIDFHSRYIRVKYAEYPGVRTNGVLRKIVERMDKKSLSIQPGPNPHNDPSHDSDGKYGADTITHAWFWPTLGHLLRENDIEITETGTSNFGIWETRFPAKVTLVSQVLWGSIGYATAACQGAASAAKDMEGDSRRTILFAGDGSFQLTCQEVSTMLRNGLNPIIFVICNAGFTIERSIHGENAEYNNIQLWRYKDLVPAFGAREGQYKLYTVKTKNDVQALFKNEQFAEAKCLRFVEMYMPKEDMPVGLKVTAGLAER
ncbi:hypothetical protein LTR85_005447 [Meristemomyces frigidus]|nr:hypothetical protein LTR85_005447 [Meristemomyces frigidus]